MTFKKIVSKSIALALVVITVSTPIFSSVKAMENRNIVDIKTIKNITSEIDVEGIYIEQLAIDLYKELYPNGKVEEISTYGIGGTVVKNAAKWLKSNAKKILSVLGKYAALKGGVAWFIDIVDAVAGVSATIDDLVYNIVDKCMPSLTNKQVATVTRVIRVLMPI